MSTDKLILWIAAALISGFFCAYTAMAEVEHPESYKQLTAVEMAPGQTPILQGGAEGLAGAEARHREALPMQLDGAMKKVSKARYTPTRIPRSKKARAKKHARRS